MNDPRTRKLKMIQTLVENLSNRRSRHDDSCRDVCWDEKERKQVLKDVAKMDKEINDNIAEAKKVFAPILDSYKDAEICMLLYVYASAFSSSVSRRIDSRDLETVIRGSCKDLPIVLDALEKDGNLFALVAKKDMRRGSGFDLEARSFTLLHKFLIGGE